MQLELFKGNYVVYNLENTINSPIFVDTDDFYYITNIENKLSLICLDKNIPEDINREREWKLLKVIEPLSLYIVGILNKIEKILKDVSINIFGISTFDSNYILVKDKDIEYACKALMCNGYEIV